MIYVGGDILFVSPMLLHSIKEPFDDDSYIAELKFDGIRLILSKFNDQIKLFTRHNNEVTSKFPELLDLDIPNGTVLDGEVIVAARDGASDFEAIMERFMSKNQIIVLFTVSLILFLKMDILLQLNRSVSVRTFFIHLN